MNQDYLAQLEESYTKDSGDIPTPSGYEPTEWAARIHRCSRRLYAAVCFRETALTSYQKTGSTLLPSIGYYYSLYHMGVALLCIEHSTSLKDLVRLNHNNLRKLIDTKLVAQGFLSREYLDLIVHMKRTREYANYFFGYEHTDSKGEDIHLGSIIDKAYDKIGAVFDMALAFIEKISSVIIRIDRYGNSLELQIANILSGILEEDLSDTYLSEEDSNRVLEYLLFHRLIH